MYTNSTTKDRFLFLKKKKTKKQKTVLDILERLSKFELHPLKNAVELGDSEEL